MDPSDPLRPKFRNYPAVLRATKAMNRACLWLFGFSLQVNGFANAEAAFTRNLCPVVVANHISFLDIWLIGAGARETRAAQPGGPSSPPAGQNAFHSAATTNSALTTSPPTALP